MSSTCCPASNLRGGPLDRQPDLDAQPSALSEQPGQPAAELKIGSTQAEIGALSRLLSPEAAALLKAA
jgi:hypothetical protein